MSTKSAKTMITQLHSTPLRRFWPLVCMHMFLCQPIHAFQNELLGQALSAWNTVSNADELLFAAVNLLESPTVSTRPPLVAPSFSISPSYTNVYYNDDEAGWSTLTLTPAEQEVFDLMRAVRDAYCPYTTIRVAGGWVRDKLIGQTVPHDIDFVLSDMSGKDFCRLVETHLGRHASSSSSSASSSCHSQHLQTATMDYNGFSLDFAQLRYEIYRNGRIPDTTGRASPVEDAFRRDLTVNALYYNLQTNQVEDWTERGLEDLQQGLLATPLHPLGTLLEDPLRTLRAVRFLAQLPDGFHLDPALLQATRHGRVRQALQQKVSRQRVGQEIDALFAAPRPERGLQVLMETQLIQAIFSSETNWAGFDLLRRTQHVLCQFQPPHPWDRRYLSYAAFLKPAYEASTPLTETTKKSRRNGSIVYQFVTQGLQRPAADAQAIERILCGAQAFCDFLSQPPHSNDWKWDCYSRLQQMGPHWKESLLLALVERDDAVSLYQEWTHLLADRLGLDQRLTPLLNGKQIRQTVLPGLCGQDFKRIMEAQEEWQVRHGCSGLEVGEERWILEAQLIHHLVDLFPEYRSTRNNKKPFGNRGRTRQAS